MGGGLPAVADCKVRDLKVGLLELVPRIDRLPSLHPDDVRMAGEMGKPLFSGRIEIQGVPKFCFLQNLVFG